MGIRSIVLAGSVFSLTSQKCLFIVSSMHVHSLRLLLRMGGVTASQLNFLSGAMVWSWLWSTSIRSCVFGNFGIITVVVDNHR